MVDGAADDDRAASSDLGEDRLAVLLPELSWVRSPALRTQIATVWTAAMRAGTWSSVEDVPKSAGVLPTHRTLLAHTSSVARLALAAAESIQNVHHIDFDQDELVSIALLHDVSKIVESDGPPEAPSMSDAGRLFQHATYAAHLMWSAGLPDRIVHGVLAHTVQSRTMPATWEAIVVHYVDYLDSDALLFAEGLPLFLHK
jgi:putative nucleotidyltransferase with HDIG domain